MEPSSISKGSTAKAVAIARRARVSSNSIRSSTLDTSSILRCGFASPQSNPVKGSGHSQKQAPMWLGLPLTQGYFGEQQARGQCNGKPHREKRHCTCGAPAPPNSVVHLDPDSLLSVTSASAWPQRECTRQLYEERLTVTDDSSARRNKSINSFLRFSAVSIQQWPSCMICVKVDRH